MIVERDAACPVCNATATSGRASAFRVCGACGLHFSTTVDHATIARVYADLLHSGRAEAIEARRRAMYASALAAIDPPRGARCLDVGCGAGEFLRFAAERGFDAVGIDAAPGPRRATARIIRAAFPCPEAVGDERFDIVTFFNSLNYVDDPVGALREAHRLLGRGGRVLVRVPNVAVHAALHRVAARWLDAAAMRHPRAFTATAIGLALRRAGFVDVRVLPSVVATDPYGTGAGGAAVARRIVAATTRLLARCGGDRWLLSPSLLAIGRRDARTS